MVNWLFTVGACGRPVSNTMAKIVDIDTGEVLGPGQQGELCVSGPQVYNSSATMIGPYSTYGLLDPDQFPDTNPDPGSLKISIKLDFC